MGLIANRFEDDLTADGFAISADTPFGAQADFDETAEWDAPPASSEITGLTFTFDNPINSFGFDLDNWGDGTPSSLYLIFDDGEPIRVATATPTDQDAVDSGDPLARGPGLHQAEPRDIFIGAIDDSGTFTSITFFGIAFGDALVVGNTIRYAHIPVGFFSGGGSGYVDTAEPTPFTRFANAFNLVDGQGTLQTIATELNTLDARELEGAVRQLFPFGGSAVTSAPMQNLSQVGDLAIGGSNLFAQTGTVQTALTFNNQPTSLQLANFEISDKSEDRDLIVQLAATPHSKFTTGNHGVWLRGFGSKTDADEDEMSPGYDSDGAGIVAGYGYAFSDNFNLGATLSASTSDLDLDDGIGEGENQTYAIGSYFTYLADTIKLRGALNVGYSDYENERLISIGAITERATSDFDGIVYSALLSMSRLYSQSGFDIEPRGTLKLNGAFTDSYEEAGAGALNMDVDSDHLATLETEFGIGIAYTLESDVVETTFELQPFVGRRIEIDRSDPDAGFTGTANNVTVGGRDQDLTYGGAAASIEFEFENGLTTTAGARFQAASNETNGMAFLRAGYQW